MKIVTIVAALCGALCVDCSVGAESPSPLGSTAGASGSSTLRCPLVRSCDSPTSRFPFCSTFRFSVGGQFEQFAQRRAAVKKRRAECDDAAYQAMYEKLEGYDWELLIISANDLVKNFGAPAFDEVDRYRKEAIICWFAKYLPNFPERYPRICNELKAKQRRVVYKREGEQEKQERQERRNRYDYITTTPFVQHVKQYLSKYTNFSIKQAARVYAREHNIKLDLETRMYFDMLICWCAENSSFFKSSIAQQFLEKKPEGIDPADDLLDLSNDDFFNLLSSDPIDSSELLFNPSNSMNIQPIQFKQIAPTTSPTKLFTEDDSTVTQSAPSVLANDPGNN
jgi:hypothetical protein